MKASLAVIIPAFNENRGIKKCIGSVERELSKIKQKTTLFVVNDGSTDSTLEILTKAKKKYKTKLEVISYKKNKGYGLAIATGLKQAIQKNYTYALIMDSDLTNDPKLIPLFLKAIEEGYDCVKASRYIKGGNSKNVPLRRRLPSVLGNKFAGLFFHAGIHDYTNGFRIVRLSKIRGIHYKERGFAHILEEVFYLKTKHAKFAEIPITLTTRKTGASKFRYNVSTFWSYAKYPIQSLWKT